MSATLCVRTGLGVLLIGSVAAIGCSSNYDELDSSAGSSQAGSQTPATVEAGTPATGENATPKPGPPATPTRPTGTPVGSGDSWITNQQNLPFDVAAFLADREPPADDPRIRHYRAALAAVSPELGGANAQRLGARISELGGDVDKLAAGSVPLAEVEQVLRSAQTAIAELRQAQATPVPSPRTAVFVYDLRVDALMPEIQAARDVARLLTLEIEHARRTQDIDAALEALQRTLQLSQDLQPRGTIVSQLVSIAIDGVVFSSITQLLLNDPNLGTQHCDRLIEMLQEHDRRSMSRYSEGLKAEYVMAMNSIAAMRDGELEKDLFFGLASSAGTPPGELAYDVEFSEVSRLAKVALEEAEVPYPDLPTPTRFTTAVKQTQQEVKAALQRGDRRVPIAAMLMLPGLESAREAVVRGRTALGGLQCLLAIRRYQLQHQTLPTDLAAAIAESPLENVPQDAFVDQPLKFVVLNGTPTVYSVGKDRRDDKALRDWQYGREPGDYLFQMPTR